MSIRTIIGQLLTLVCDCSTRDQFVRRLSAYLTGERAIHVLCEAQRCGSILSFLQIQPSFYLQGTVGIGDNKNKYRA